MAIDDSHALAVSAHSKYQELFSNLKCVLFFHLRQTLAFVTAQIAEGTFLYHVTMVEVNC